MVRRITLTCIILILFKEKIFINENKPWAESQLIHYLMKGQERRQKKELSKQQGEKPREVFAQRPRAKDLGKSFSWAAPQHPWKVGFQSVIKFEGQFVHPILETCFPFQVLYFLTITVLFLCYRSDWMSQKINLLACDWNGHHPRSALNFS